jgi:hypothetical protein
MDKQTAPRTHVDRGHDASKWSTSFQVGNVLIMLRHALSNRVATATGNSRIPSGPPWHRRRNRSLRLSLVESAIFAISRSSLVSDPRQAERTTRPEAQSNARIVENRAKRVLW